jgi:DNA-binding response OmpR family regulator
VNRILVIDPANLFVQYVELVLDRYGYSIRGAASGMEAVTLLKEEPFDLVIAQETLTDMDWQDFGRSISMDDINAGTPCVVLSSDPKDPEVPPGSGITVARVRTKPVSMRDLLDVIWQHLPYRNRRRGIRASLPMKALIRDEDQLVPCQILNLSEGGVFVMRKKPRPIDTPIELLIPFKDSNAPLKVQGKVVYVVETARGKHPRGMGIQFNELKSEIRESVRVYLEDHVLTMLGKR